MEPEVVNPQLPDEDIRAIVAMHMMTMQNCTQVAAAANTGDTVYRMKKNIKRFLEDHDKFPDELASVSADIGMRIGMKNMAAWLLDDLEDAGVPHDLLMLIYNLAYRYIDHPTLLWELDAELGDIGTRWELVELEDTPDDREPEDSSWWTRIQQWFHRHFG